MNRNKPRSRRWWIVVWISGSTTVAFLALGILVWRASSELVFPARRPLMDYHHDWLDRPENHGITIHRWKAMEGQTPCLAVSPDATAGISKRGRIIRVQLNDLGIPIPEFGTTVGQLVLLHGRNGRKEDLLPVAERFCAVGFSCLLPDLPAHGESPVATMAFGSRESEAAIPGQILSEARERFAWPVAPAGLWGMSMGGSFLAAAAARTDAPWKAAVVVCSFDALAPVVEGKVFQYAGPAALPLSRLIGRLADRRGGIDPVDVRPAQWARQSAIPVLMAHGDRDALIPTENGRRLFQAYASPDKKWITVPDGGHDNILITDLPLYAEMAAWYLKYLK